MLVICIGVVVSSFVVLSIFPIGFLGGMFDYVDKLFVELFCFILLRYCFFVVIKLMFMLGLPEGFCS